MTSSTGSGPGLTAPAAPVLLDATAIEALEWLAFPDADGVQYKLLWRSGWSVAGIMRLDRGAVLAAHTHQGAHHHMWVLSGEAEMLGRTVTAGCYVHVPIGVEHGIAAVGPEGFSMLYLYLRDSSDRTG
jgi:oxalate decarboxylase/phosphoglucose isomerase-like protein (cupin superfamily)